MLIDHLTCLCILTFVIYVTAAIPPFPENNNVPSFEIYALHQLYNATHGLNWDWKGDIGVWNFTGHPNPCADKWQGVTCTLNSKAIERLVLVDYNLVGSIPDSIGDLTSLSGLILSLNKLSVSIPDHICNITSLQEFSVDNNFLTGTLPSCVGNLTQLRHLSVNRNGLRGAIPETITECRELSSVDFSDNYFSGSLPVSFSELTSLASFQASSNRITGSLPTDLGNLTTLNYFDLSDNRLEGSISASIGMLYNLSSLILSDNNLEGSLPETLGDMAALRSLQVTSNRITGAIPQSVGNCSNLATLELDHNFLRGALPSTLFRCTALTRLMINNNRLSGTISEHISELVNLVELDVSFNSFTGSIPVGITTCPLASLLLDSNSLNGSLPENIGDMQNLERFSIRSNNITRSIPSTIGNCRSLVDLNLRQNALSGEIPDALWSLTQLSALDLGDNMLEGTMSAAINNCSGLVALELSGNLLQGELLGNMDGLKRLLSLAVSNNQLTGSMPDALCTSRLEVLNLENNLLNGSIPECFGDLEYMTELLLGQNQLTGSVPARLCNWTELNSFVAQNNFFTGPFPPCLRNETRQMVNFIVSNNFFSGPVFEIVGHWRYLHIASLDSNLFTGTIPSSIANASYLYSIIASHNFLEGSLPESMQFMSDLEILWLDHNKLTGPVPLNFTNRIIQQVFLGNNYITGAVPFALLHLEKLVALQLQNNLLSGAIPGAHGDTRHPLATGDSLTTLWLNNNLLSGSIPPSLSTLTHLHSLLLYSNRLTGTIDNVFDSSRQPILLSVDVSNNQISGKLPAGLFSNHSRLQSFAAVSNCFTGSLPVEICDATLLRSLVIDGMASASACQTPIFPLLPQFKTYYSRSPIVGGVPQCLYDMKHLATLHISGNGLTGSLPRNISSAMVNMSVSHNQIIGAMPDSLQRHIWLNLDLSYNRVSGTLIEDYPALPDNYSSLYLEVNRLSGKVAPSLRSAVQISLLEGSMFECDFQRTGLPENDPYIDKFQCGSNSVDVSLYTWLALSTILAVVVALLLSSLNSSCADVKSVVASMQSQVSQCMLLLDNLTPELNARCRNISQFSALCAEVRGLVAVISLAILLVATPTYAALSNFYQTYRHKYAWVLSAAFLSGQTCAIVLILLGFGLCALIAVIALRQHLRAAAERSRLSMASSRTSSSADTTDSQDKSSSEIDWRLHLYFCSAVVGNIAVMISLNVGYLFIYSTSDSKIVLCTQVAVAGFKLTWNNLIWDRLFKGLQRRRVRTAGVKQKTETVHRAVVATALVLFNNLATPFIAELLVSPYCFYNAIVQPAAVQVEYYNLECTDLSLGVADAKCSVLQEIGLVTSYPPPFVYSFQCSSAFIATYAAIYVYMLVLSSLVVPLVQFAFLRLQRHTTPGGKYYTWLNMCVPNLLRPEPDLSGSGSLFRCDLVVVQMVSFVAILLTFGFVFPPVAVVALIAIVCTTLRAQVTIGWFVETLQKSSGQKGKEKCDGAAVELGSALDRINADCLFARDILTSTLPVALPFAVFLYAYLVFDTLADEMGSKDAAWAPCVVVSIPVLVYVCSRACLYLNRSAADTALNSTAAESSSKNSNADGPRQDSVLEMNPMFSSPNNREVALEQLVLV